MNNKFIAENKSYDVISDEEYYSHPGLYDYIDTAIVFNDYIYPIRNKTDTRPGIYKAGIFDKIVEPETEEEKRMYSTKNIINFQDQTSLEGIIEQQNALRDAERIVLTSPDNIYMPIKSESDSPAMRGLKEAVERKHIDLDKYESRFGNNFPNDKRILTSDTITLSKLVTMATALDMSLTLTIGDREPSVPNPINGDIVIDLLNNTVDVNPK